MNGMRHPSSQFQRENGEGQCGYDRRPSRWRDDVLRALRTNILRLSRVDMTVNPPLDTSLRRHATLWVRTHVHAGVGNAPISYEL